MAFVQFATFACIIGTIWILCKVAVNQRTSKVSKLPGPKRSGFLFGNLGEVLQEESGVVYEKWTKDHGPFLAFSGLLGSLCILNTDLKALDHILISQSYAYPKPNSLRGDLIRILGNGLVFSEGESHKRQRKLIQPMFSSNHLHELAPVIYSCSYKLRDLWTEMIQAEGSGRAQHDAGSDGSTIEVSRWLSKATLDIIGLAAFGYEFNALNDEHNELAAAFDRIVSLSAVQQTFFSTLMLAVTGVFPFLVKVIRTERIIAFEHSLSTMERAAKICFDQKRAAVDAEWRGEKSSEIEALRGKDLMSLLVKANMAKEKAVQLSDAEVMGQMTTFILAGHETTATSLSWTLYQLARRQDVQNRLRQELVSALRKAHEAGEVEIPSKELSNLPYLDAVYREILRLLPPVPIVSRETSAPDEIPLSEPITLKDGTVVNSVSVDAGQTIIMPITTYNRSKAVFGDDADEFKPERWLDEEKRPRNGVGMWSSLLTFSEGPRNCVGFRFALLEMKVILAVLLTSFSFAERDEGGGPEIERRADLLMRPRIKGEKQGTSMPLRVSLLPPSP